MYIIHFFYRILTKPQAYLLLLVQQFLYLGYEG